MRIFILSLIMMISGCVTARAESWSSQAGAMKQEIIEEFRGSNTPAAMVEYFAECFANNMTAYMDKLRCEPIEGANLGATLKACIQGKEDALAKLMEVGDFCAEQMIWAVDPNQGEK